jgi:trehalose synthase
MDEVTIPALPPDKFDDILGPERAAEFAAALDRRRSEQGDGTLWHINSTAAGGGVAEMLQSILSYIVGAGITCRWLVIDAHDGFFALTKQLHNLLHGDPGDGAGLPDDARDIYERALSDEIEQIVELVQPGDAVILNDPQTLGLAPALRERGAQLIWACHIGADTVNEESRTAWKFLAPYAACTERQVFSRPQYVPDEFDRDQVAIIPPCLDAFSPKNQTLDDDAIRAILTASGVVPGEASGAAEFTRQDQSIGKVTARADMMEDAPIPADARIVTQISRWDSLKDHAGVMTGFVEHVPESLGAHLVLAGPSPESVTDDPEGLQVIEDLKAQWAALPDDQRARVHLACLPMDDLEENAAIVNALQRRSDVIVQKSLAEGFGLTVAEAMWKGRPTVGARVGGIQDQIDDEATGLLIDDPEDPAELGRAVTSLLEDPEAGARLGSAARERVIADYLAPCHLTRYLDLVSAVHSTSVSGAEALSTS